MARLSIFQTILALASALTISEIKDATKSPEIFDYMVEIRRHLHQHPELMFHENYTSSFIKQKLTDLGISYSEGWSVNKLCPTEGGTGIIAHIGTGSAPVVALRADIDALAIHEATDVEFRSKTDGKMHACGHDAHTAMLLGAARVLKARESEITGTIRLIFQPAEEGGAGALMMAEEGVLTDVDRIFGLHQFPDGRTGEVSGRAGGIMAGSDFFWGAFHCKGGHGAMPHLTVDPVPALASFISAAQTIVGRTVDPLQAAVVSITSVGAAEQYNVIADKATFGGTFRSYSLEGMDLIRNRLKDIGEGVARAHGCERFEFNTRAIPYIPTINTESVWTQVKKDLGELNAPITGKSELTESPPFMPAEDFAFFLQKVPGVFFFLAAGSKGDDYHWPLHSNKFKFDEDAMPHGAALLASAAVSQLGRIAEEAPQRVGQPLTPVEELERRMRDHQAGLRASFTDDGSTIRM